MIPELIINYFLRRQFVYIENFNEEYTRVKSHVRISYKNWNYYIDIESGDNYVMINYATAHKWQGSKDENAITIEKFKNKQREYINKSLAVIQHRSYKKLLMTLFIDILFG